MRRTLTTILSLSILLSGTACDDDDVTEPEGPFTLTFAGDATFQDAHGGQDISVALLNAQGAVLETMTGTVSADADPSFSFTFDDALEEGQAYGIDYWIDSNFAGGTAGVCDPPVIDHQWHLDIPTVQDDVERTDTHRPGETTDVCDSF